MPGTSNDRRKHRALFAVLDRSWVDAGFFRGVLGGDIVHLLADAGLIDAELDGQVDDVAGAPVERQPRCVVPQHEAEHDWHHEGHHAPLGRVHARRRRDVLREKHADDDEDGQNVHRVGDERWSARTSGPGAARPCFAARGSRRRTAASG